MPLGLTDSLEAAQATLFKGLRPHSAGQGQEYGTTDGEAEGLEPASVQWMPRSAKRERPAGNDQTTPVAIVKTKAVNRVSNP